MSDDEQGLQPSAQMVPLSRVEALAGQMLEAILQEQRYVKGELYWSIARAYSDMLMGDGRFDQASEIYRGMLSQQKDNPDALFGLGRVLLFSGDYAAAAGNFRKASKEKLEARIYEAIAGFESVDQEEYLGLVEKYKEEHGEVPRTVIMDARKVCNAVDDKAKLQAMLDKLVPDAWKDPDGNVNPQYWEEMDAELVTTAPGAAHKFASIVETLFDSLPEDVANNYTASKPEDAGFFVKYLDKFLGE